MDVLLYRQEYLVGVDGLDEVVGYLCSDGLIHDVFLLALRHHDHGRGRLDVLYLLKGLQTAQSRHLLVEQYEVESVLGTLLYGIAAVAHGAHIVAFLLQEDDVGVQQLYLVVDPK